RRSTLFTIVKILPVGLWVASPCATLQAVLADETVSCRTRRAARRSRCRTRRDRRVRCARASASRLAISLCPVAAFLRPRGAALAWGGQGRLQDTRFPGTLGLLATGGPGGRPARRELCRRITHARMATRQPVLDRPFRRDRISRRARCQPAARV